jgi:hypothetical protein
MSLPYAYVPIHLCRALSPRGRAGNNGSHVREDQFAFFPADSRVSICAGKRMRRNSLPRSDTSSVHDRGRVKPVCKTSSETGLGKQIVRILRAELRCNDIEPVLSKWRLAQRGHFEVFIQYLQML